MLAGLRASLRAQLGHQRPPSRRCKSFVELGMWLTIPYEIMARFNLINAKGTLGRFEYKTSLQENACLNLFSTRDIQTLEVRNMSLFVKL